LGAPVGAFVGSATNAATDATVTIEPSPRARRYGSACLQARKVPSRALRASCSSAHSGADVSVRVRSFLLEVDDEFEPIIDWEHDAYRWCDVAEAVSLLCWRNIRHSLVLLLAH
jgi:hypothetical protein